ncbi:MULTISPECIES: hypothetical protein [unclassified Massilia]|uniref:hypothetical protein n=1 Tax=unclassified Massilia TaxID=2609279 RepID=UPI00178416B9|nr:MULTISPECIES: hypothetical protein [unclassified Massilia]MBD8531024.1 hypothetical protein [Massilia sp. CFBP 13647]MBD8674724.1 hypothetical protein [Massilia sp. CFBP 13721]
MSDLAGRGRSVARLEDASAIGVDLLITEFDVNDRRLPADIAGRAAGVAAAARDYLDLTLSYPRPRTRKVGGSAAHAFKHTPGSREVSSAA